MHVWYKHAQTNNHTHLLFLMTLSWFNHHKSSFTHKCDTHTHTNLSLSNRSQESHLRSQASYIESPLSPDTCFSSPQVLGMTVSIATPQRQVPPYTCAPTCCVIGQARFKPKNVEMKEAERRRGGGLYHWGVWGLGCVLGCAVWMFSSQMSSCGQLCVWMENVCVVCTGKGVCVRVSGGVRYLFCSKQAAAEGRYENTNVTVCLCVGGMRHFFCLKKQGGSATQAYARTHIYARMYADTNFLLVRFKDSR